MTLYHFGNCLTLIYAPFHMIYKYSSLSEYGAFWKCIQAGFFYIVSQLCKMLLLATFFPDTNTNFTNILDIIGEIMKNTVDIVDLICIYFVLSNIAGRSHIKILTVAIGWDGAEIVFSKLLLLWIGARGAEFDWKYIMESLDSNINLVSHITTVALVWMWSSRLSKREENERPLTFLMIMHMYKTFMLDFFAYAFIIGPWTALFAKALLTFFVSFNVLRLYIRLQA